jgi:hypothetical protein
MSDKLPGSSGSNPITYRDYEVYLNPNWMTSNDRWAYMHKDFDGPEDNRYGYTASEQEAKDEIDERYDDV